MKILIVEDDISNAELLEQLLKDNHYVVDVAHDGRSGLEYIEIYDYDLLVIDVMLPEIDGISLCHQVRQKGYPNPILLLTAVYAIDFRVKGLDAGADDYLTKPYNLEELLARIRALLRRGDRRSPSTIQWGDIALNPSTYEATYKQQSLNLTPKEYRLLELFMRRGYQVSTHTLIIENLWSLDESPQESSVKTYVKRLRKKLEQAGAPKDSIETVYGLGYRLNQKFENMAQI